MQLTTFDTIVKLAEERKGGKTALDKLAEHRVFSPTNDLRLEPLVRDQISIPDH